MNLEDNNMRLATNSTNSTNSKLLRNFEFVNNSYEWRIEEVAINKSAEN